MAAGVLAFQAIVAKHKQLNNQPKVPTSLLNVNIIGASKEPNTPSQELPKCCRLPHAAPTARKHMCQAAPLAFQSLLVAADSSTNHAPNKLHPTDSNRLQQIPFH